jgi:hypothetical protein
VSRAKSTVRAILKSVLPNPLAWLQAARDWNRLETRLGYGGPFNGQAKRQDMVREILSKVSFEAIVETGSFRGTTTEFLRDESGLKVFTVEINPRCYYYCRRRFRGDRRVKVFRAASPDLLTRLGMDHRFPKRSVFFYLDAHRLGELPLVEEIRLINRYWTDYVVMIDDFSVPDDPGYGFDDLGEGKQLRLENLPLAEIRPVTVLWPSASSDQETGFRRGCVLLVTQRMTSELEQLASVRPDHTVGDAPDRPRFEVPLEGRLSFRAH